MPVNYKSLKTALSSLGVPASAPVIIHASHKSFGGVEGGPETVVRALADTFTAVIAPTHTYRPMVTPPDGPPDNAITYGSRDVFPPEPFTASMPADVMMGIIPETLRQMAGAKRSMHPILSFAGIRADEILAAQTLADPFAPIGALAARHGWVLLLGVNHTVNTSIHYAEKLAKRPQFIRWAMVRDESAPRKLTPGKMPAASELWRANERIIACPGFPSCSMGFQSIEADLAGSARKTQAGAAMITAVPLAALIFAVMERIRRNKHALLCDDPRCERCSQVKKIC